MYTKNANTFFQPNAIKYCCDERFISPFSNESFGKASRQKTCILLFDEFRQSGPVLWRLEHIQEANKDSLDV